MVVKGGGLYPVLPGLYPLFLGASLPPQDSSPHPFRS